MNFYDTHAHLDYPDFAHELPEVIARAAVAGITRVICIGVDFDSSRRAIELAERFPRVYAAVGWHPTHATEAPSDIRETLRELGRHPKVVALGETGLDHHHLPSEKPGASAEDDERYKLKQAQLFQQHLEVAAELGLNCVIHQRDCFEATLRQFLPFADKLRGVFHCFVGTPAEMERVRAARSLVSFTGILTFKNAQTVRDTLAATPADSFMLETDCPYLAPVPYRNKRCEPAHVKEIAAAVAHVRNCSLEALSRSTCETAHRFFSKMAAA